MSNSIDTNSLLLQLRSLAQEAGMSPPGAPPLGGAIGAAPLGVTPIGVTPLGVTGVDGFLGETGRLPDEARPDFGAMIGDSLRAVNDRSQEARRLTTAYEGGHPGVELADVMVAVQKARVSFEALTQVRNRMVSAYKDIMNTPL